MRDFTEIWQLQDTIITAVNACGYGVWDLHATNWGFHLELTEHLDDAEICNICSQLPLSGDYKRRRHKRFCSKFVQLLIIDVQK